MRKLGRPSDQRKAMLRGLVTSLLWNGKIETTMMRAKETQKIAEKLITKAIRSRSKKRSTGPRRKSRMIRQQSLLHAA